MKFNENHCPKCGTDDLTWGDINEQGGDTISQITCLNKDCGLIFEQKEILIVVSQSIVDTKGNVTELSS